MLAAGRSLFQTLGSNAPGRTGPDGLVALWTLFTRPVGYRSLLGLWAGGVDAPSARRAGYRGLLAFWAGGVSAGQTVVVPVVPVVERFAGGGWRWTNARRKTEYEIYLERLRLGILAPEDTSAGDHLEPVAVPIEARAIAAANRAANRYSAQLKRAAVEAKEREDKQLAILAELERQTALASLADIMAQQVSARTELAAAIEDQRIAARDLEEFDILYVAAILAEL